MASNLIVCGGTFDHFHKGHKTFLKHVFSVGKKILVGVTSDEFIKSEKRKAKSEKLIESFEERKQAVLEFVEKEGVLNKIEIVKIDDLFGPTLSKDLLIDGIVVSDDSKKGAGIINQKRKDLELSPLKIIIAPSVMAEDGNPISSARIRGGEINGEGKLYVKPEWLRRDLVLSENLRQEFKEPFGELRQEIDLKNVHNQSCIITVGDETSKKFNESSIKQNISVIDFRIARKEAFSSFSELGFLGDEKLITVNNPAGHVTADLFNAVSKIFQSDFKKRIILRVVGEEDLAVLPLVLAAPLDTIIYYGQPGKGLIKIIVSTDTKSKAHNLVLKLKPI